MTEQQQRLAKSKLKSVKKNIYIINRNYIKTNIYIGKIKKNDKVKNRKHIGLKIEKTKQVNQIVNVIFDCNKDLMLIGLRK